MKILIVYDSLYGNTEKIAKAIAAAMTPSHEVKMLRVGEAKASELESLDLLLVGSPTQGGRATPAIQEFLNKIPANALKNVGVTSFDTRISAKEQASWLRILIGVINYAAPRIADSLKGKGGNLVVPAEGFIVEDKEGPLRKGELERAAAWAKGILEREG